MSRKRPQWTLQQARHAHESVPAQVAGTAMAVLLAMGVVACAATVVPGPTAPAGIPAKSGLMAGASVRVITPAIGGERPVYIGGLGRGRIATGINDDLFARALVLTDPEGGTVGFVALDLIGLFHDDILAMRDALRARHPEVSLDHLAIACTHTHTGPDVIGLWTPIGETVDADYIARVRDLVVEAVAEAWQRRRPATLFVGQGNAPGLAKDTRLPKLTDDTVLVMGLRARPSGDPIATLVNWNSHPSVNGEEETILSADFPRATVSLMEREWGGTAIYTSGALGGQIGSGRVRLIDPATGEPPASRMRLAELVGEAVGGIALEALREAERAGPVAAPAVRARTRALRIPLDNSRFANGLAIGVIHPRRLYPRDDPASPGSMPVDLPQGNLRPGVYEMASEVAVVDIGPARWALLPGEIYPELSLGIFQEPQDPAADFPGAEREPSLRPGSTHTVFIIGLANDEVGYIIPRSQWDMDPPFAYGRDEMQYGEVNSPGPQTAPIVMGAIAEIVEELDRASAGMVRTEKTGKKKGKTEGE